LRFVFFGVATLCRLLGGLGDLGWKWVEIGGEGVPPVKKLPQLAVIAKIAGIEKEGLAADYADDRRSKRPEFSPRRHGDAEEIGKITGLYR